MVVVMKQKYLLLFFFCIFCKDICIAQPAIQEEILVLTQKIKQKNKGYLADIESYYTKYNNKYSTIQTINAFEGVIKTLSKTNDIQAIVDICMLLSHEYRVMITQDINYIKRIRILFLELGKSMQNTCEVGELYTILGMLYTHENIKNYDIARMYFEKNIELGKQAACKHNERNTVFPYIILSKHIYEKVGDYGKALTYYLRAAHLADSLPLSFEKIAYYQDRLARFYYKTENYNEAYQNWEKTLANLQRANTKNRELTQVFNNLGLAKRKKNALDNASHWFDKALQEAISQKDTIWEGIVSGNLGCTAFLRKDYPKAIQLLEKDIRICLFYKEYTNAISSLIYLGKTYQAQKNYDKALLHYKEAQMYLEKEYTSVVRYEPQADLRLYLDIYKGFSDISDISGNYEQAYQYLKLHKKYSDTLTILQNKENLALQQAQQVFNTQSNEKELAIKQQNFFIAFLLLLLLFVVGISLLVFRNYALAANKKQLKAENLALANEAEKERNQRLQEAMIIKKQEMAIATLQMQQKNELLVELKKEIGETENTSRKLEKIIDYIIDLDNDWEEFKKHFEQIHPLFFHKLSQISDKITPNDFKHCAYIRINLDMKQVAHLMRIAPESVKMSRNRLRKKLQLLPEADLYKFLANL